MCHLDLLYQVIYLVIFTFKIFFCLSCAVNFFRAKKAHFFKWAFLLVKLRCLKNKQDEAVKQFPSKCFSFVFYLIESIDN